MPRAHRDEEPGLYMISKEIYAWVILGRDHSRRTTACNSVVLAAAQIASNAIAVTTTRNHNGRGASHSLTTAIPTTTPRHTIEKGLRERGNNVLIPMRSFFRK